jgi:hypothetical protein
MSAVLPDLEELSGWGTHNHYFFEIQNRTGHSIYILLCLSSKNLPEVQKQKYEQMINLSNPDASIDDWTWKNLLRSDTEEFGDTISEENVCAKLDVALKDVLDKQDAFLKKWHQFTIHEQKQGTDSLD